MMGGGPLVSLVANTRTCGSSQQPAVSTRGCIHPSRQSHRSRQLAAGSFNMEALVQHIVWRREPCIAEA